MIYTKGKTFFLFRVLSVHSIFIIYSCLLWWKLFEVSLVTQHKRFELILACCIWSCFFFLINCVSCYLAVKDSPPKLYLKTWLNIPMLLFIAFTLPPYGFTLNHLYGPFQNSNMNLEANHKNSTWIDHKSNIPTADFVVLQMAMPVLLLTFIIYPLPRRAYSGSEYLAIALEFMNAFDIMDMVPDIFYIKNYGLGWVIIFYMSLGISVFMLSLPVKIETSDIFWPTLIFISSDATDHSTNNLSNPACLLKVNSVANNRRLSIVNVNGEETEFQEVNSNQRGWDFTPETKINETKIKAEKSAAVALPQNSITNKKKCPSKYRTSVTRQVLKSLFTMLFMDLCFALVRFKIMINENSPEHGFNMFVKNIILTTLHMSYFIKHLRSLIDLNNYLKTIV